MMDVRALDCGSDRIEVSRSDAGFIARTPLCFGFLSGTIRRDAKFPPAIIVRAGHRPSSPTGSTAPPTCWRRFRRRRARRRAQAALRFCLAFPAVSTTIPGILHADGGRSGCRGQRPRAAAAAGRCGGPGDQSKSAILRFGRAQRRDEIEEIAAGEQVAANAGGGGGLQIASRGRRRGRIAPHRPAIRRAAW